MWYFAWILGILLACSLGIINGLWLEQVEANELADKKTENDSILSLNNEINNHDETA